tara:strand:+ start:596 stop:898 length:303 start_codon:yes stop_codon:yes gene_type:complete
MLTDLIKIIRDRKKISIDKSYTSKLLDQGIKKCIEKLSEEFEELKEALKNDRSNVVHESADVIYHLLVTLEASEIKFEDVILELEKRKKQSGIDEKNSRK